jgi:sugar lactone lactonase YvrE
MAQSNNASVYTIKNIAGVLPPVSAATPNTLFLQVPDAVLADQNGNVYLTDTGGHRVWKIDSTGKLTVVLGTTVFGTPSFGKAANVQPAGEPSGLAMDATGNLYVADRNNNRIYKIDTSGIITLVAGPSGNGRFSGDGRLAIYADINTPRGMTVGPDGNLYFADTGNQRIREINLTTGVITTVAGSSASGSATGAAFGGDLGSGSPPSPGLAIEARLSSPEGVAFDSLGDMFIADTGNNRIRMVNPSGIITTVAGRDLTPQEQGKDNNGNAVKNPLTGANYSAASAPYPSTCNYAPSGSGTRVGFPIPTTGTANSSNTACALVGDGKDPSLALLSSPATIVVDSNNNVIFSDRGNARIRELTANPLPTGTNTFPGFSGINTIVGTGSNANAGDGGPGRSAGIGTTTNGLSLDPNGKLYFTDRNNNRVRVFDTVSGLVNAFAGSPTFNGDQAALQTMFSNPTGVAVDAAGNIYIADSGNNLLRKIDTANQVTTIAGSRGGGGDANSESIDPLTAALSNPTGIAVDPSGTLIYFADTGSNRIRRISGGTIQTVAGCVATRLTTSANLAQNCALTTDGLPATILKLNLSGATTQNTKRFTGVALDAKGVLYFSESGNQVVRKLQSDGTLVTIAGQWGVSGSGGDGNPAVDMFLSSPEGVAVDKNGVVFVVDKANFVTHSIANGIAYPVAGQIGQSGTTDQETNGNQNSIPIPAWNWRSRTQQGVAVDNNGNVFISDTADNRIYRIPYAAPAACVQNCKPTSSSLDIQYVAYRVAGNAGNAAGDFVFDYTAPASATAVASTVQISFPVGVAVDSSGDVIFADCANNLIRMAVPPASK